jgi:hypothetical protein
VAARGKFPGKPAGLFVSKQNALQPAEVIEFVTSGYSTIQL